MGKADFTKVYHYADSKILMGLDLKRIFNVDSGKPPQSIKQSLIVIKTYSRNTYRGDPDGIKTFVIEGLNAPRLFYSPKYEGQNRNNPIYDGRATLYWNTAVRTDENVEAKVEFYTGDRKTEMEVVFKGIGLEMERLEN